MKQFNPTYSIFDYKKVEKKNKPKAVLRSIEGYATYHSTKVSSDNENRNKHFYKDGFWKDVIDTPRTQELLDTKTFFGSSRHPRQKEESPLPEFENVSHAISNYRIDDVGVFVEVDILDTPTGRILDTMVDYGSEIGISTRAYGDLTVDSAGNKIPDPKNYFFVTWDFVTFPAFSDARMKVVNDSMDFISDDGEDFNIEEIIKKNTPQALLDHVKGLPKEERMPFCDWLGIEEEEETTDEENKTTILDEALSKVVEVEKRLENDVGKLLGFLSRKKSSDGAIKIDDESGDVSKLKFQYETELKNITKSLDNYKDKVKDLIKVNDEVETESKGKLREVVRQKNRANRNLSDMEERLNEALELLDCISEDFEVVVKEKETLKGSLDEKTSVVGSLEKEKSSLTQTYDDLKNRHEILLKTDKEDPSKKGDEANDSHTGRRKKKPFVLPKDEIKKTEKVVEETDLSDDAGVGDLVKRLKRRPENKV